MALLHEDVTDGILKAFYHVYNEMGFGFAEKCYENALIIELGAMGYEVATQVPICVRYKGHVVGDYFADLVVNGCVIVELKAADSLVEAHAVQLQNYLKATGMSIGLLLNFGKKPDFKRKIFETLRSDPRKSV